MATSGSVDFSMTTIEIIKDALILIGGIEDEGTPTSAQEDYAKRALNRMTKAWSVRGLKIWLEQEHTLQLIASTATYTLSAINRPTRIYNVRKVLDSIETPVRIVTRQEYMNQPSKESEGKPVFVYYDSQIPDGIMYVWPTPDAADNLKFTFKSYLEDFDNLSDDAHFPSEWLDAIVYNLAYRLCPKYEVSGEDRRTIREQSIVYLEDAEDADMEQGSLYIEPYIDEY